MHCAVVVYSVVVMWGLCGCALQCEDVATENVDGMDE